MKKLENIPKKNIFEVPEGYFEKLPGIVQSRVAAQSKSKATQWVFALRYALPILILACIGIFWFNNSTSYQYNELEAELESLQPGQLSIYLNDTDLSTEELVETVAWSEDDLQELEENVYSTLEVTSQELDNVLDEYDVEL
jgi:hypothetical protein